MKKCYVDAETTGLNPWLDNNDKKAKGVILSIGFVLDSKEKLEVIITPTPEEWGHASPRALEVNGMTWDFLKEYGMTRDDAKNTILDWLREQDVNKEEYVFFAQNAPFDKKFLLNLLGASLEFINAPADWMDMIPIYKLIGRALGLNVHYQNTHHISKQLGVREEPKPHEAIEGALAVKRNFNALKKKALEEGIPFPY